MLIKRSRPGKFGLMFAVWPRWTPDGWVALEWLHWKRIESWGWGSGDTFQYSRIRYKLRQVDDETIRGVEPHSGYHRTPPINSAFPRVQLPFDKHGPPARKYGWGWKPLTGDAARDYDGSGI